MTFPAHGNAKKLLMINTDTCIPDLVNKIITYCLLLLINNYFTKNIKINGHKYSNGSYKTPKFLIRLVKSRFPAITFQSSKSINCIRNSQPSSRSIHLALF